MDLVDHDPEVEDIAGRGVGGLGLVAEHAELGVLPAAVDDERVVTRVAGVHLADLVPHVGGRHAIGPEIEFGVGVVGLAAQDRDESGHRARAVDADRGGLGLVEGRREDRSEGVGEMAEVDVLEGAARVGGGLGDSTRGARRRAGPIGSVVARARVVPGDYEGGRADARRLDTEPVERRAERVGDLDVGDRFAVGPDRHAVDLDDVAWSREISLSLREVVLLRGFRVDRPLGMVPVSPRRDDPRRGWLAARQDERASGDRQSNATPQHTPTSLAPARDADSRLTAEAARKTAGAIFRRDAGTRVARFTGFSFIESPPCGCSGSPDLSEGSRDFFE